MLTGDRRGIYIFRRDTDSESYIVVCNFENESVLDTYCTGECVLSSSAIREINGACAPYECAIYNINFVKRVIWYRIESTFAGRWHTNGKSKKCYFLNYGFYMSLLRFL